MSDRHDVETQKRVPDWKITASAGEIRPRTRANGCFSLHNLPSDSVLTAQEHFFHLFGIKTFNCG